MFTFKVKAVRSITSPSNDEVTTYYTWVNFRDLPDKLPLEVNPRKPKMNTSVAKQLIAAVINPDSDFDINNRGIVITAKSFKFHTTNNTVDLDLDDDESRYGILDGGHTYTAIIQNRDKLPEKFDKYVKLEIIMGENLDVLALADARNTSAQVSDIALFELDSKFEIVKNAIKNESYHDDVAFKDFDNKRIPVVELLKLMFGFNIKRYPDDSGAPVSAYSGKAVVFKDYKAEYETADNIYEKLVDILPKLVELYEKIQEELPEKYMEYKREEGKKGKFGALRGVETNGTYATLFNQKPLQYEISIGFILPIFGAFRALLTDKEDHVEWVFDPIMIWEKAGVRLVQNTFDTDTNPQQVGKSKTLWQSNYRIVDSIRKDLLLEKLMKEQGLS